MKKCNRCSNVIDWERPFCPLCGGQVTDVPRPERTEPVAVAAPTVIENTGIPEVPQMPPTPEVPQMPQIPEISQIPKAPQIPEIPETPQMPEFINPLSPPVPQLPPTHKAAVPAQAVPIIPAAAMTPPVTPPVPPQTIPAIPSSWFDAAPQAGSISQIHNTGAAITFTPPPGGMISQIHQTPASLLTPNLQDEVKPNPDGNDSQDDFLRMFPGAKG